MNVLIVGGGNVGATLATRLRAAQHQVKLIEIRHEHLAALQRDLPAERWCLAVEPSRVCWKRPLFARPHSWPPSLAPMRPTW